MKLKGTALPQGGAEVQVILNWRLEAEFSLQNFPVKQLEKKPEVIISSVNVATFYVFISFTSLHFQTVSLSYLWAVNEQVCCLSNSNSVLTNYTVSYTYRRVIAWNLSWNDYCLTNNCEKPNKLIWLIIKNDQHVSKSKAPKSPTLARHLL